jgi:23S rRNA pseudouridine2605 synthase
LAGGVAIDERKTAPARVCMIKEGENDWFSITIHEGRNRQVRRMCEAVSLSVVRLKRVRYGMLTLGELKPGEYRFLTAEEVTGLRDPKRNPAPARANSAPRSAAPARTPQRTTPSGSPASPAFAGKRPSSLRKNSPPRKP